MAIAHIDRLDDAIGAGVEQLVVSHHRRRLNRRGWRRAYDPPRDGLWCAGDPPPRDGNAIEVLIDGEDTLARETRLRLWREHLQRDDVDGAPDLVIDEIWRPTAEEGDHLVLLPGISRRSGRFLGPINGLLVDG